MDEAAGEQDLGSGPCRRDHGSGAIGDASSAAPAGWPEPRAEYPRAGAHAPGGTSRGFHVGVEPWEGAGLVDRDRRARGMGVGMERWSIGGGGVWFSKLLP